MATKKTISPTLKKYLDTKKKPTLMIGPIERYLMGQPREPRSTTVLHPSEFTKPNWCPREGWFLLIGELKVDDGHGLQMLSIFEEGHGIHEKWQRWAADAGILHSAESPVVWPPFRVEGNADGILMLPNDSHLGGTEPVLLEIKSIGMGTLRMNRFPMDGGLAQSFRRITRPFNDHIRQATFYAWVLRRTLWPDMNRILFLYECKEDQAAREFVVTYNEEYIEVALEKLESLFPKADGVLVETPPRCTNGSGCICERY
jgi:hypothetical protein